MDNKLGMLVLCRHIGQSIMIGDEIEIMISRVNGGYVALAIKAPKDIIVHRKEIWRRVQTEKEDETI